MSEADAQSDLKRGLLIIAVCLLLGAAVNVAVAFGCAWSGFAQGEMHTTYGSPGGGLAHNYFLLNGWPAHSMQAELPDSYNLHPLWPGFAVNTLFYAAILWFLIRGPFALRRSLRLRRGLCPKCAYPMGESAVCTECGKTLPSRTPLA